MVCIAPICPYTACVGSACPSWASTSAKYIRDFTTDELLAEIRRRCET